MGSAADLPQPGRDLRCPVCMIEYSSLRERKWNGNCPFCGTVIAPLQTKHDGYIEINWQDMRVLAIYAQRWSTHFDLRVRGNIDALKALQNILQHLRSFRPKDAPPIVPSMDLVIMEGLHGPPIAKPPGAQMELDEQATLEPDEFGMIKSPFRFPRDNT